MLVTTEKDAVRLPAAFRRIAQQQIVGRRGNRTAHARAPRDPAQRGPPEAELAELRERLSQHIYDLYGVRYDPHTEIIITTGSSEGLDVAVRAEPNVGPGRHVPEAHGPVLGKIDGQNAERPGDIGVQRDLHRRDRQHAQRLR